METRNENGQTRLTSNGLPNIGVYQTEETLVQGLLNIKCKIQQTFALLTDGSKSNPLPSQAGQTPS